MAKKLLCIAFIFYALPGLAQPTDEQQINAVIQQFFTGMHKTDTVMIRNSFTEDLTLATVIKDKSGKVHLRREGDLNGLVKSLSLKPEQPYTEEIWNVVVQQDGDFAQAWCDYAFFIGKTFSHCGIDAFHLVRSESGWKIFHIADTRRKSDCVIPENIKAKYN